MDRKGKQKINRTLSRDYFQNIEYIITWCILHARLLTAQGSALYKQGL